MSLLSIRLYRLLYRATREMFQKKHREFLYSTLDVFQYDLERLHRPKLYQKLQKNPRLALKTAFREGKASDIDVLLSFLPKIFQYSRAMRLLNESLEENSYDKKSTRYTPYNMIPGAFLIYKLYHTERQLQSRSLQEMYNRWMIRMTSNLKYRLNQWTQSRQEEDGIMNLPLKERRRRSIYYLILALDELIREIEEAQFNGEGEEQLVDQVFLPFSDCGRDLRITYSVVYSALINRLEQQEFEAFGVPFPKHFLTRLVTRQVDHHHNGTSPFPRSSSESDLLVKPKASRLRLQESVAAGEITGKWLCTTEDGFSEICLEYHQATNTLQAVRVDVKNGKVQPDKVVWSLVLPHLDGRLRFDHEYFGMVHGRQRSYSSSTTILEEEPEFLPTVCSIWFKGHSPKLFGPKQFGSPPSPKVHVEMYLSYREMKDPKESVESKGNKKTSKQDDFDAYYCSIDELDWCLMGISDEGVMIIPALQYTNALER